MTVLELKNYLEKLCYLGKTDLQVIFAEDPFESELIPLEAFSHGNVVTLTRSE